MSKVTFKIIKRSNSSRARLGVLHTPHGDVQTPAFIFCGTKANVRGVTASQLHELGTQIILSNTYHTLLQPGIDVLREAGGLQKFTGWNGPMFTDSGGFQVFSLGYGGINAEIKGSRPYSGNKTLLSVTEEGATFRSYINGNKILLTPELAIQAQVAFGADLIVCLDVCTPHYVHKSFTSEAMLRSKRWALRCMTELKRLGSEKQALLAVIQGGIYEDLRRESADFANQHPFDGFAIGGSLGVTKQQMYDITQMVCEMIDPERSVHLLGIGGIPDIFNGVKYGIDTFDCVSPTRIARHGIALVKSNENPLETGNNMYINHLLRAGETLGGQLITLHNIRFMNKLMEDIRDAIANDTLEACQADYC